MKALCDQPRKSGVRALWQDRIAACAMWICLLVPPMASAKEACNATAEQAPKSFDRAVERVWKLPEYIAQVEHVRRNFPGVKMVVVLDYNKQQSINGHCYWGVMVAEDHPTHQPVWNIFYVPLNDGQLMVFDILEGEPINLSDWRVRRASWEAERKAEEAGRTSKKN